MRQFILILFAAVLCVPAAAQSPVVLSRDTVLMGSAFRFTAVHETWTGADKAVNAAISEVVRIESVISSWSPDSETSAINRNAGVAPVPVSDELFGLIQRSKKVSALSNGYFDISFASIDKVWQFNGEMTEIPSDSAITASVADIGFKPVLSIFSLRL